MSIKQFESNLYTSLASCNLIIMLNYNHFLESKEYKNNYFNGSDAWNKQILDQVSIGNHSIMLMMLYALIVLPKEQFDHENSDYIDILNKAIDKSCIQYIKNIETSYPRENSKNLSTINFNKHMRNAVSHGRSQLTNEETIIFTDVNCKKNYQASLEFNKQDVGLIIKDVSSTLNQYLNEKFIDQSNIPHH